jgi:hypothetical protein
MWPPCIELCDFICSPFIDELFIDEPFIECIDEGEGFGEAALIESAIAVPEAARNAAAMNKDAKRMLRMSSSAVLSLYSSYAAALTPDDYATVNRRLRS